MEKLEWYEYVFDSNSQKPERFNIFNNWPMTNEIIKDVKKYKRGKYTRSELEEAIKNDVMWQMWSRAEYEVGVTDRFTLSQHHYEKLAEKLGVDAEVLMSTMVDLDFEMVKLESFDKIDVYDQVELNIVPLTDYILKHYKELYKMEVKKND